MGADKPVTVLTGGSGGFGQFVIKALVEGGHFVVFQYVSAEKEAKRIEREFEGSVLAVRADITCSREVSSMFAVVEERFARLDNLICNAGITIDGIVVKYREQDFDRVLSVNLKGCLLCVQNAVPLMAASGGGHIIAISSYSGLKGRIGQVAYSSSKGGIIGLCKTLAKELSSDNIRVNSVLPGYLPVGMGERSSEAMKNAERESLLNCLSNPDEVARFLVFLCSTKNITGQIFILDSREVV